MARAIDWAISREVHNGGSMLVINTGSDEWNYQVSELADAVATEISGTKVEINPNAMPDNRSYKVDFSKIEQTIGFKPTLTVQKGIQELIFCFRTGVLSKTDFENKNLEQLKLFFKGKESALAK